MLFSCSTMVSVRSSTSLWDQGMPVRWCWSEIVTQEWWGACKCSTSTTLYSCSVRSRATRSADKIREKVLIKIKRLLLAWIREQQSPHDERQVSNLERIDCSHHYLFMHSYMLILASILDLYMGRGIQCVEASMTTFDGGRNRLSVVRAHGETLSTNTKCGKRQKLLD